MKHLLYIFFILIGTWLNAQEEWRDSLKVARKAYSNKEYSKALKYYESAQKKAPEDVDLSDEMGQSAYKAREFEQAEKIYQQSASSKKTKKDKSRTYHNMGNSRMQKKDYSGAIESYKEALRNNPKDEETRYNLSEAIRRLKDEQKKQDNQNKDNKDSSNDNKDQQNNKDNKGESRDKPKNDPGDKKENKGGNESKDQNGNGNPSKIPNKTVERMLDQLMKEEAATKRKMGGSKENANSVKSGKDW